MSQMLFFTNENTNFWIASVGWEGKVAFIKTPLFTKNNYSIPLILKTSVHVGDLYAIDYCDNYVATGGVDNKVCIWNSLTGNLRTKMDLPNNNRPNTFVCSLIFVKTKQITLLFVLQNSGDLHLVNPINETSTFNILKVHFNSMMDFTKDSLTLLTVGE